MAGRRSVAMLSCVPSGCESTRPSEPRTGRRASSSPLPARPVSAKEPDTNANRDPGQWHDSVPVGGDWDDWDGDGRLCFQLGLLSTRTDAWATRSTCQVALTTMESRAGSMGPSRLAIARRPRLSSTRFDDGNFLRDSLFPQQESCTE